LRTFDAAVAARIVDRNAPQRDKFYPDFVALLNEGRFFVVEYKGALLAGAGVDDTNEKRAVGRLWESRSGGKGAFLVVEKVIDGRDMRAQMLEKVAVAQ
jgi:type III restriction enzyme